MSPTLTGTWSTCPAEVTSTVELLASSRIPGVVTLELTVPVSAQTTMPMTSTPLAASAKSVHVGASRTTRSIGSVDAVTGCPSPCSTPGLPMNTEDSGTIRRAAAHQQPYSDPAPHTRPKDGT